MNQPINLVKKADGWEVRFRIGTASRIRRRILIKATDETTARGRAGRLRARLDALVAAGRTAEAVVMLAEAASQRTERGFAAVERAMRDFALEAQTAPAAPAGQPRTFSDIVELWLSGEIARRFPDVAKVKGESSVAADRYCYSKVIHPLIGQMPIRDITLPDAERVKAAVAHLKPSSRRKYETIVRMCLDFAVYPLRLLEASPIPRKGFVARAGKPPEFQFLYPEEEAQLVSDEQHALVERAWLAFAFRNGCRASEVASARWGQVDFRRGGFTLFINKTDAPRMWKLEEDVLEALRAYREALPDGGDDAPMFPGAFPEVSFGNGALRFRRMLLASGVTRESLHTPTGNLSRIRLHDTRATFATLALATGRSEQWVMNRTGHTTSAMLARYSRRARSARDFELGWFKPMTEVLRANSGVTAPSQERATGGGSVGSGGGELCSVAEQTPGQKAGPMMPFEPKKAGSRASYRGPRANSSRPQDTKTPGDSTPERPEVTPGADDGPPGKGGEGQTLDPTGRQILLSAIERATAAGQWTIVERLTRLLDGEVVAASATR
jgi:integrase